MLFIKFIYRLTRHFFVLIIITTLIIPIVITDICIEIYHRTCFLLTGVPYVKRSSYIKIDRHKLKYLNIIQKAYCVFCGYANGVFAYWVKIAGETEEYWCGIQHENGKDFIPPDHHKDFPEYGDKNNFKRKY